MTKIFRFEFDITSSNFVLLTCMCYLFSMILDGLRAISEMLCVYIYIYIYKQKKQTLH